MVACEESKRQVTAKILDMGRRACRWCKAPTGGLALTCKRFDCQLKTSQWKTLAASGLREKRIDEFLEELRKG